MKIDKSTLKRHIKEELENLNESMTSVPPGEARQFSFGEMAVMETVKNVFRDAGMTDTEMLEDLAFKVAETVGKDYDIVQRSGMD